MLCTTKHTFSSVVVYSKTKTKSINIMSIISIARWRSFVFMIQCTIP